MRTKQNQKSTIENQTYSKNLLKYNNNKIQKYKQTELRSTKLFQKVPTRTKKCQQDPESSKKVKS